MKKTIQISFILLTSIPLLYSCKKNSILSEEYLGYKNTDEQYSIGAFTFDSTVKVVQNISTNLIEDIYKTGVYARNIELVHKKFRELTKNFGSGEIEKGVDYTWTLIEYGHQ